MQSYKYSAVISLTKTELMRKKTLYLKDDTMSLLYECVFPTGISFEGIVSKNTELTLPQTESVDMRSVPEINTSGKQSDDASSLKDDFKALFTNGSLSDITLCTEDASFPAHSAVFCARSPVFKAMFSDDMKKTKGIVDIVDLDAGTMRRMLLYMYTDSLEGLQWESALRLYEVSDKYEILFLRKKCSAYLEDHLSPTNVCDLLVLADRQTGQRFQEYRADLHNRTR
ncbi:speckle-type POZ protein-like B [Trichonephila clavipes]|nr:speckle-type POZ protein-like B [Trichonephila clavipes]